MKSHDMNRDVILDCYRIAIAAWWEVYGSEDMWDALIGSRDLDRDRLSIREGWLVIVMIAVSGMAWRHGDERLSFMIHDVYLKSHDMKYRSRDLETWDGECYQRLLLGVKKIHHLQGGDGFMKCAEVWCYSNRSSLPASYRLYSLRKPHAMSIADTSSIPRKSIVAQPMQSTFE